MREINIVFSKALPCGFTAAIKEMPEIEVIAETLHEAQAHIFQLVPMVMEKCYGERSYKVNIMLQLSVPKA